MKPPICGKCATRHWSTQPCGKNTNPAGHRTITSNAPGTLYKAKPKPSDRKGQDKAS